MTSDDGQLASIRHRCARAYCTRSDLGIYPSCLRETRYIKVVQVSQEELVVSKRVDLLTVFPFRSASRSGGHFVPSNFLAESKSERVSALPKLVAGTSTYLCGAGLGDRAARIMVDNAYRFAFRHDLG
jgi:hypothetical protein